MHSCETVIRFRPIYTLVNSWSDNEGWLVLVEFKRHGISFRVASLYTPSRNPQRDDFLAAVSSSIDPSVPTLVCGDLNSVFDSSLDRRGSNALGSSRKSSNAL